MPLPSSSRPLPDRAYPLTPRPLRGGYLMRLWHVYFRGGGRLAPAQLAGIFFVVLALATELRFRRRDPTLALEGEADSAILAELAIWALVGGWITWQLIRSGWLDWGLIKRSGTTLKFLTAVAVMIVVSSYFAPGSISLVRGVQYATLVILALLVYRLVVKDAEAARVFWLSARRTMWLTAFIAVVCSLALSTVVPDYGPEGLPGMEGRYEIFETHPIATAAILGLAFLALAAGWLASPDPWLKKRWFRLATIPLLATFAVLILSTRARGALAATFVSFIVLTVLSRHVRRRGLLILSAFLASSMLMAGLGLRVLSEAIIRGQSTDQLLSLTGRTRLFEVAWSLFMDNPITGYGYHAARVVFLERVHWAGHTHNAWFEIAINHGLIGLILFGSLLLLLGLRLCGALRSSDLQRANWSREGLTLMTFVLILGMVSAGFAGRPGSEVLALTWAVLLADLSREGVTRTR